MNCVQIMGRAGKEPELRYTQSGKAVCSLSLATNGFSNGQKTTEWHRVVLWEKQAEACSKFVHKGDMVGVEGRLTYREYTDRGGQRRQVTEVVAHRMHLCGRAQGQGDGGGAAKDGAGDEDIPF